MSGGRGGDGSQNVGSGRVNDPSIDAVLDPWCEVPLHWGARILFGFALWHPTTGGLGWTMSTPIMELDETAGRAKTLSGRRYSLGRRIEPEDIPDEGEEAWLAFDLLLGSDTDELVPPISAEPGLEQRWVTACKMSRHLKVPAPGRSPRAVDAFVERHGANYRRVMKRILGN